MAFIIPPGNGLGRESIGDLRSLIRAGPSARSLRTPKVVLAERRPDEASPDEFLRNERRRVGKAHDAAELLAGDPAASDCVNVSIYSHAGQSPLDLARQRRRRSQIDSPRVSDTARYWTIEVTAKGERDAGPDAGLRLADLAAEMGPTFQALDAAGRLSGWAEWNALAQRRDRDCLVGVIVANAVDGGEIIVFNHHALSQLYEDNLVQITADEGVFDGWQLAEKMTIRHRLVHGLRLIRGIVVEIEVTSNLIVAVVAAVAAVGVVLRFLGLI